MTEWQPIETAPKDRDVLLLVEGKAIQGCWSSQYWDGGWDPITLVSHGCGCCGEIYDDPTHWMPLPEPPTRSIQPTESWPVGTQVQIEGKDCVLTEKITMEPHDANAIASPGQGEQIHKDLSALIDEWTKEDNRLRNDMQALVGEFANEAARCTIASEAAVWALAKSMLEERLR